jgi:hypothetical protein
VVAAALGEHVTATALLIHGGESTAKKLRAALPGFDVFVAYREGLSSAYNEVTGVAKEHPYLEELLESLGASWRPGDALIVYGYSAGAWALRYYLRDPETRDHVSAAVFLDGLYGASGDQCNLAPYEGVVRFAELANAEPDRHRLIMTSSLSHPAPRICSHAIERLAPGPGVFVVDTPNADHGGQQGIVGPAVTAELIAPWVRDPGGISLGTVLGWAALAAGVGLLVASLR